MRTQSFAGPCQHKRREEVVDGGGTRIALRCVLCLDILAIKQCSVCETQMPVRRATRRYCSKKCQARAFRARRRETAQKEQAK